MKPAADDSSSRTESIEASLKLSSSVPPGCVVTFDVGAAALPFGLRGAGVKMLPEGRVVEVWFWFCAAGCVDGVTCATTGAAARTDATAQARRALSRG